MTGAGGFLGSSIVKMCASNYEVYSIYHKNRPPAGIPIELDLNDLDQLDSVVRGVMPDIVMHAAALTDVDLCERDRQLAMSINYGVTARLSTLVRAHDAHMIYISTDYVFDGTRGFYGEDDGPNPINHYGYTKLKGEEAVRGIVEQHCIARTSVIYGSRPAGGKANFALWIIEKLRRREPVNVLIDQYVSPTLNTNLAEMLKEVMERRLTGTYHLSGATRINRYEFARKLCNVLDLDSSLLKAVTMKDMNWIARRPKDSSLDVSKAMRMLNTKPLDIGDALLRLKGELGS